MLDLCVRAVTQFLNGDEKLVRERARSVKGAEIGNEVGNEDAAGGEGGFLYHEV